MSPNIGSYGSVGLGHGKVDVHFLFNPRQACADKTSETPVSFTWLLS
jgi:hypothetical protein